MLSPDQLPPHCKNNLTSPRPCIQFYLCIAQEPMQHQRQEVEPGTVVPGTNLMIHQVLGATMYATPAQVAELQKGQVDALYALSHAVFDATEKFVDLNLAAAKALMDESAEKTQALLGVKDVQELLTLTGGFAQPAIEKLVSYSRNVYSIATGTGAEFSKIVETQVAEGNKKVTELVDFATKNAPAGSEPAVSMFKS